MAVSDNDDLAVSHNDDPSSELIDSSIARERSRSPRGGDGGVSPQVAPKESESATSSSTSYMTAAADNAPGDTDGYCVRVTVKETESDDTLEVVPRPSKAMKLRPRAFAVACVVVNQSTIFAVTHSDTVIQVLGDDVPQGPGELAELFRWSEIHATKLMADAGLRRLFQNNLGKASVRLRLFDTFSGLGTAGATLHRQLQSMMRHAGISNDEPGGWALYICAVS